MNEVIIYILFVFAVLGCIDKVFGNQYGLGEKFDEAFMVMGDLALSIIGIYCFAPIIANLLSTGVSPILIVLPVDPSIFPASILACDMGGYTAAMKMAESTQVGLFSGLVVASMLGATVVFTIPIGSGLVEQKDYPFFIKGIFAGIMTIPLGIVVGGLSWGLPFYDIMINIIPIGLISAFLAIGLFKWPDKAMKGFQYFSKVLIILGYIGLILSIFEVISGKAVISGMEPFAAGLQVVGSIVITLSGAYPMMYVVTKMFKKQFSKIGNKLGLGENAVAGIMITLANNVPLFGMFKDLDDRGKVVCSAFAVSGAFTFGGQLGFVAGIEKAIVTPFIVAKLTAGIGAVVVALFLTKDMPAKTSLSVEKSMMQ